MFLNTLDLTHEEPNEVNIWQQLWVLETRLSQNNLQGEGNFINEKSPWPKKRVTNFNIYNLKAWRRWHEKKEVNIDIKGRQFGPKERLKMKETKKKKNVRETDGE